jgi:hypothetical protein
MCSPLIARCLALFVVLQGGDMLIAQSVKAATRAMRSAIAALDEKPDTSKVAVAAINAMAAFDGKRAAAALLDAAVKLAGMAAPIVEKRRKMLASGGGSGRLKRTRYELRGVDDASEAVVVCLAKLESKEALETMLSRLTDRSSTLPLWIRLELAARIAELPEAKMKWREGAKGGKAANPDTLLSLIGIAAGLGNRAGAKCGEWLGLQLGHANVDVRLAAAKSLGVIGWAPAIELLIARLDQERGKSHEALLDALTVLTGQDPGDSKASWQAWFKAEGGAFVRGEKPLSQGKASVRKKASLGDTVVGTYFGIEQMGDSILYVFDNSLSMKAKVGKAAAGRQGAGKAPTTGPKRKTRWDVCREELEVGLRGLRANQKFNLVSFANKARSYSAGMQHATKENVANAIEWIANLELELQTNVFDALELGFQIAGRGSEDRYYASDVDTMFFLSDGAPTIPNSNSSGMTRDDSDRILASVQRWNALGRITIYSVGLGLQNRKKDRNPKGRLWPMIFLKKLAEQNSGRYVSRR